MFKYNINYSSSSVVLLNDSYSGQGFDENKFDINCIGDINISSSYKTSTFLYDI